MAPINRNIPSPFQNSGVVESISYRFYDTLSILTGATADLTAFASAATADNLGNFEGAGSMPAGQAFHVFALRLLFDPAGLSADVLQACNKTVLKFTKENSKRYAWGPSPMFPAGMGFTNDAVTNTTALTGTNANFTNNGVPVYGNVYRFHKPVSLFPQQNFKVILTPYAPTLGATVTVRVIMEGILERNLI